MSLGIRFQPVGFNITVGILIYRTTGGTYSDSSTDLLPDDAEQHWLPLGFRTCAELPTTYAYAGRAAVAGDPRRMLGIMVLCPPIATLPDLVRNQHASQAGQLVFLDQQVTKSSCLLHEFLHVQNTDCEYPA
jgi:hypothetical protein